VKASFTNVLKINAAAVRLASAVFYAKAEAFGGETQAWDELDVATRHKYTVIAAGMLRAMDPQPPKGVSFATGLKGKVIGVLFPKGAA